MQVGGLMLELATGKRPFWWMNAPDLMLARYTKRTNALQAAKASGHLTYLTNDFEPNPKLKVSFEKLILQCLSEDPADRPTAVAVLKAVRGLAPFSTAGAMYV